MKSRRNILFLTIGLALFILIVNVSLGSFLAGKQQEKQTTNISVTKPTEKTETLSYKGKEGVDALTLLQEHATLEQSSTGLVTVINGKKADEKKREYWAFYINGKLAEVGPQTYVTKNTDTIEWKLESY